MSLSVDLNSDMGEGFGPWKMGDDAALLDVVTSANIACGFHAGDPDQMLACMKNAVNNDVGIGAHPGFLDLQGFGRRRMNVPIETLKNWIRYQVGAADAMARVAGGRVRHVKLHGALSNMTCEEQEMARATYEAVLDVVPDAIIMVLAATAQERAVRELGCLWCGEIFADRPYNDDATLLDRSQPGAVIHDEEVAAARVVAMVKEGAIICQSGKRIETRIDTICLHGDEPSAVALAKGVRTGLETAGIEIRKFDGSRG